MLCKLGVHVLFVPGQSDLLIGQQISDEYELHMPESIVGTLMDYHYSEEKNGDDNDEGGDNEEMKESYELLPEDKAPGHSQQDNSQEQGKTVFKVSELGDFMYMCQGAVRSCEYSSFFITFTYPLTLGIVRAPQMTSQPVFSIFLCSPLPSGT